MPFHRNCGGGVGRGDNGEDKLVWPLGQDGAEPQRLITTDGEGLTPFPWMDDQRYSVLTGISSLFQPSKHLLRGRPIDFPSGQSNSFKKKAWIQPLSILGTHSKWSAR